MDEQNQRDRLLAEIKFRLVHEFSELKISLQNPPNVRMAVDRITNLERWLKRLE